ncbi:DUF883 family protein [Celeribacter sp.]|uniref:DUF883 family protein n=1 Tax=Celeribacter sp. TaxID=1890673 RepID=UPI003A91B20A
MARATPVTKDVTTQDLQAQIITLKEDIHALTQTLGESAKSNGQAVKDSAHIAFDAAKAKGAEQAEAIQKHAQATYHQVEDKVRDNPSTSVGIAAGLGFLVGLVAARR